MTRMTAGSRRRLRSGGAFVALAAMTVGLLSTGLTTAANAAPVTVAGSVTDAAGNPISGSATAYDAAGSYVASSYTSAGRIRFDLEPGTYKFSFSSSEPGMGTEYYLDKTTLAAADAVAVGAATTLQPWVVDTPGPHVAGYVTDPTGAAIKGAMVAAYDATTGESRGQQYTDERGVFVFDGTGAVKLQFSANKFASEYFNDKQTLATADKITIPATGVNVGQVVLSAGAAIGGTVTSDAGAPLSRVYVAAYPQGSTGGSVASDYTDPSGNYVLEGLAPGNYQLRFTDDVEQYAPEWYNNSPDQAGATPIAVGKDQWVGGINAGLALAPVTPLQGIDVTGTVTTPAGTPAIGARVRAVTTPADPDDSRSVDYAITDRSGNYALAEVDGIPNETEIKIVVDAYQHEETDFLTRDSWYGGALTYAGATPLAIPVGGATTAGVNIVTNVSGGLAGTVSSDSGDDMTGTRVAWVDENGTQGEMASTSVEKDGTFESKYVAPGKYKVWFYDREHVSQWWKDTTVPEDAVVVDVKPMAISGGLSAVMTKTVKALERPVIKGNPWVGKALRVDHGRWNVMGGVEWDYSWLANGVAVGNGPSYTPTKADLKKKLTVAVTNHNEVGSATVTTAASTKVGYKPKVKVKMAGETATFTVKAQKIKSKKIKGTIVVKFREKLAKDTAFDVFAKPKKKAKVIAKGKVKKGQLKLSLKKLKKGKNKVTIVFLGKGKVGSIEINKVLKGR